jgi:hypothetical protein
MQVQTVVPRDCTATGGFALGHQQQPAIGLGRKFVLQHGFDARLDADVAGQPKADELGTVAHTMQAHGAALAFFRSV